MKITVIGAAGTVGSCVTFALINNKLAEEIVMIDPFETGLKGHWMDMVTVAAAQGIIVKKGNLSSIFFQSSQDFHQLLNFSQFFRYICHNSSIYMSNMFFIYTIMIF